MAVAEIGLNHYLLFRGTSPAVVRVIPAALLDRPRPHNFDEIGWRPVPRSQPATSGYLIEDYVAHLEHHVAQMRRLAGQDLLGA